MNIIMGAGDFAREVYEYHKFLKIPVSGFYDEITEKDSLRNLPIYRDIKNIPKINEVFFVVGTGNPIANKKFTNLIEENGLKLSQPIICDSYVGENVFIGNGSVICPKSVLTCDISIGKFCAINISCTIGHDCFLDDFVVLSPNCSLSGHTKIKSETLLGTSVVTIPKRNICNNVVIGALSCVVKDITESGTYIGSPAKRIK